MTREEIFKNAGRFSEQILDCTNKKIKILEPFMGSGVGGSSAIYGMTLERFKSNDMENWPFSYFDFSKYYDEAEKLFRVKSSKEHKHVDLLFLSHYLKDQGLNPYLLPMANEKNEKCGQCISFLCDKNCKNHSGNICVEPAIQNHGAKLLTECEVQRIEVSGNQAKGIKCLYRSEVLTLKSRNVVLACGALKTPLLLMNSKTADFPNGLGNQSGLVGRNLMRHYVDLYALKIDSDPENPHVKEIAFNDFGTVQSFGRLPPVKAILDQMQRDTGPLFIILRPFMKLVLKVVTARRLVLASVLEDSPQFENRVWIDEKGRTCISYKISKPDYVQIKIMRDKLKHLFKPFQTLIINSAEKNGMLAHVCGTTKMGMDPNTSVVDNQNRVHNMANLYVADASFFPTSGGTNPGLTIAANALRMAELLIKRETSFQKTRKDKRSQITLSAQLEPHHQLHIVDISRYGIGFRSDNELPGNVTSKSLKIVTELGTVFSIDVTKKWSQEKRGGFEIMNPTDQWIQFIENLQVKDGLEGSYV